MTALPPGPGSRVLSLLRYARDPIACMVPMAQAHGDPFCLPGTPPLVCTGDPDGIKSTVGVTNR
jgi:hypothetical protein